MNNQLNKKEVLAFFKKYGYILVLSLILLSTAITLAFLVTNPPEEQPTGGGQLSFYSPILNATVAKGYSDTSLVYNSTLKQWEAHKAITFTVPSESDVFAVADGEVDEVYSNYLEGTVVVIKHAGNLKTVYGSLAEGVTLKAGDTVKKGDIIGKASKTANAELNLGNHLRFQLLENDTPIDPSAYLNIENK